MGLYNYRYVLRNPYFLQALKNTFLMVVVTVPLSTGLALLISVGLSSIKRLRELYQTVYFLPYVTNTLAVGLVFMILFRKTPYSDGLMNALLSSFGLGPVDFIDGPYDAVALFGVDLNAAGMNTLVGYIYDMLYGNSGGYPSYASAAAILLFAIVLTIAAINLLVSKKHVHY